MYVKQCALWSLCMSVQWEGGGALRFVFFVCFLTIPNSFFLPHTGLDKIIITTHSFFPERKQIAHEFVFLCANAGIEIK